MRVSVIVVLIILLFGSCISEYEESAQESNTDSTTVVDASPIYAWQGNLDGRIPVLMWYRQVDSVILGSVFYTNIKDPQPIKIIGTITDEEFLINEFLPDGQISGYWHFTTSPDAAEGTWSSPTDDKQFNISMMHIDTPVSIDKIGIIKSVAGTYTYSVGEEGPTGHLSVEHIESNKYIVNFEKVTGPPAHNIPSLTDTVRLQGHTILYSSTEYGDCSFKIHFYNGFAIVTYLNGKASCGFGHNAFIDGIYMKL